MRAKKPPTGRVIDGKYQPSSTDLFSVIQDAQSKHYQYGEPVSRSPKVKEMEGAIEEAEHALEEYLASPACQKLRDLQLAVKKAKKDFEATKRRETILIQRDFNKVRNKLRIEGPTPEVVKLVKDLAEKYQ